MKKTKKNEKDVAVMMAQIQEQLAVLDQKLDAFMTKSLTELTQALAVSKAVAARPQVQPSQPVRPTPNEFPHRKPMYAVICFECGKDSELPFKPSGNRPVYCKECFAKRKGRPTAPVSAVNPTVVAPSTASTLKPVPVSAPPVKVKKNVAAKKTVKAKKKVSKKPVAKKKTAVKGKAKKK